MLGFVRSCGEKNCSSVGGWIAGACTSSIHDPISDKLLQSHIHCSELQSTAKLYEALTFADALHGADLRVVLHGVQGKVDFRRRLLLLDGANGVVHVRLLVDILLVVLHAGRLSWRSRAVGGGGLWRARG
jgi:hypothetical protein